MLVVRNNLLVAATVCPEQCVNFASSYGAYMDAEKKAAYTRSLYKKGDVELETLEYAKRNAEKKCAMAVNKLLAWNTSFNRKENRNFMQEPESLSEAKNILGVIAQMMGVGGAACAA